VPIEAMEPMRLPKEEKVNIANEMGKERAVKLFQDTLRYKQNVTFYYVNCLVIDLTVL